MIQYYENGKAHYYTPLSISDKYNTSATGQKGVDIVVVEKGALKTIEIEGMSAQEFRSQFNTSEAAGKDLNMARLLATQIDLHLHI